MLTFVAGALAVSGAVVAPGVASAEPAVKPVNWQPCPGAPTVDCGSVEVPVDWANPAGEKIQIGLARRKAKDPAKRIGAVLMDPGGPGGSGVASVKGSEQFTEAVRARFDQVGFDPRGINTSSKLLCDSELASKATAARHPTSQADFDQLAALNRQLHDSCRANSGKLAEHVDNLNTVRDMDAIRAALGEQKLTYVGYSYGSVMGQQYAEKFPHRVRALVLDGNMDHSMNTAWDFMRSETAPVEQAFIEFAKWCDTTAKCALYGQDTKKVYAELRAKAKAGTLVGPNGKVDFYQLSNYAFGTTRPAQWGTVATALRGLRDGAATDSAVTTLAGPVANIPYPSIWCSDWRYPVRNYAEYQELRDRLDKRFPNVQWSPYVDHALTCVNSGTKTTNPQRRLDIKGAPPLVMIGNIHDPATVYEWNVTAARQSGARLITYEGWGHTAYRQSGPSPCVNVAVDEYLINLKPPRWGLSCPATEVPGGTGVDARELQQPEVGPYLAG
ncbi:MULTISPECIES: alpha/beta hydrolase [unclassified Crossiella]|uniref:alpha/beta hydrolase n=1 Tax=unclassified Crossiella TaxID=2620835 RepID=UPI001FFFF5DD|nr:MULTISPECIES: alpha/beta hydrolase [unclassified Crossiella]MCK2244753.1 alpha/beta fold hydrolase [Crossiella sp. S99.2]MCK2258249.1 alpha/beta fold hydrolase [Crossiella sp. S99.1]